VLIEAFRKLYEKDNEWTMNLVGFIYDREYYNKLRNMARGLPIRFYDIIPFELLKKLYAESLVYWHATGFNAKDACEHESFGISVVEAMASGAQPFVYPSGGVADFRNIRKWQDIDELVSDTLNYKQSRKQVDRMRKEASSYDQDVIFPEWEKLIIS